MFNLVVDNCDNCNINCDCDNCKVVCALWASTACYGDSYIDPTHEVCRDLRWEASSVLPKGCYENHVGCVRTIDPRPLCECSYSHVAPV
jgi:hypothetical protein